LQGIADDESRMWFAEEKRHGAASLPAILVAIANCAAAWAAQPQLPETPRR